MNEYLQIIPLGGVEEIGINCTLFQYRDQIIIVDAGLGFSDIDHLGIDYLIPNLEYLKANKHKIEGIFITHGHLDHIGGIEHMLKELDFPEVYASDFAMELIKNRLEEAGILNQAKLKVIKPDSKLQNGTITIEFVRVTHSIPESMGIVLRTPVGTIVHSGDFKFDNSPLNEPKSDYYRLAALGQEGVKLLISDSTNSFKPGHSISEVEIMAKLEEVVSGARGRVIVGTFASLVTRLYALVEIAKKTNRKIFITGRSMQQSIDVSRKLGYINAKDDLFIQRNSVNRFADNKVMILATGSQGESMAALSRMARGEHREVKIKGNDTVILSSSIIPGNDQVVQKLIDEISRLGAKVFHQSIMNLHTSGHGFIEDQKLMLNLVKPELFMPVHGYQYFLHRHAQTAQQVGVPQRSIIVARRGEVVEVTKQDWRFNGRIKNEPLLVSGSGVGDIGPQVLQERERLAKSGVVTVGLILSKNPTVGPKFILNREPRITSKGFVYVRTNQDVLDKLRLETKKIVSTHNFDGDGNFSKLRFRLEKQLSFITQKLTERDPLIISQVEEI